MKTPIYDVNYFMLGQNMFDNKIVFRKVNNKKTKKN